MLWRFQRGIRAMRHLTNLGSLMPKHICKILNVSTDLLAFSMTYLPGGDISRLQALGWNDQKKQSIFMQIVNAVSFAHIHGIVHRDVKPANIVLDDSGNAVLTDFDIADLTFAATQSVYGASLGTPHFAAPEQLTGESIIAHPTADIFSLGKFLYFLFTERPPPFGGIEVGEEPIFLSRDLPDADLRRVVATSIMRNPNNRYQSVQELLDAFPSSFYVQ